MREVWPPTTALLTIWVYLVDKPGGIKVLRVKHIQLALRGRLDDDRLLLFRRVGAAVCVVGGLSHHVALCALLPWLVLVCVVATVAHMGSWLHGVGRRRR